MSEKQAPYKVHDRISANLGNLERTLLPFAKDLKEAVDTLDNLEASLNEYREDLRFASDRVELMETVIVRLAGKLHMIESANSKSSPHSLSAANIDLYVVSALQLIKDNFTALELTGEDGL